MMEPLSLQILAEVLSARIYGNLDDSRLKSTLINDLSTDSRSLKQGDLFLALKGDRFDGHDHVQSAMDAGCVAAIVEKEIDLSLPQLIVADTRIALGQVAAFNRQKFKGDLVGITGSSGKTTTKEMLKAALSEFGKVLATQGNLNNDIGVPLTLLRIAPGIDYAVIEMGANHVGEIAYTSALASPAVSILTNAGEAHLEGFGSYENIVEAKGEIIDSLSTSGTAVLNFDDPALPVWMKRAGTREVIRFSAQGNDAAEMQAKDIVVLPERIEFDLVVNLQHKGMDKQKYKVNLPIPGVHNVANSLAVLCAVSALGLDLEKAIEGLATMQSVKGRLQRYKLDQKHVLLDDTYNANPSSMLAAFKVLAAHEGKKIVILGDMAELGDSAAELHEQTAKKAKDQAMDWLFCVGKFSQDYLRGFGENAKAFNDKPALIQAVLDYLKSQNEIVHILIKGSRSSQMNEIVEALVSHFDHLSNDEAQSSLPIQE